LYSTIILLLHIEYDLIFAYNWRRLTILLALRLVFLEHVIDLGHVFVAKLLIRLSLHAAHSHATLRQGHVLVHLKLNAVDIELLSVVFLAFVSDCVWTLQLLIFHRA
jgi:hypothetical protein